MDYRGKKSNQLTVTGGSLPAKFCDQTIEELIQYRRKGIPLMPHQIVYMRQNGFEIGQEAMLGRKAKNSDIIDQTPINKSIYESADY